MKRECDYPISVPDTHDRDMKTSKLCVPAKGWGVRYLHTTLMGGFISQRVMWPVGYFCIDSSSHARCRVGIVCNAFPVSQASRNMLLAISQIGWISLLLHFPLSPFRFSLLPLLGLCRLLPPHVHFCLNPPHPIPFLGPLAGRALPVAYWGQK